MRHGNSSSFAVHQVARYGPLRSDLGVEDGTDQQVEHCVDDDGHKGRVCTQPGSEAVLADVCEDYRQLRLQRPVQVGPAAGRLAGLRPASIVAG